MIPVIKKIKGNYKVDLKMIMIVAPVLHTFNFVLDNMKAKLNGPKR